MVQLSSCERWDPYIPSFSPNNSLIASSDHWKKRDFFLQSVHTFTYRQVLTEVCLFLLVGTSNVNIHIFHPPCSSTQIYSSLLVHVMALDLMMMLICMHDDESVMVLARHGTARHGTERGSFTGSRSRVTLRQIYIRSLTVDSRSRSRSTGTGTSISNTGTFLACRSRVQIYTQIQIYILDLHVVYIDLDLYIYYYIIYIRSRQIQIYIRIQIYMYVQSIYMYIAQIHVGSYRSRFQSRAIDLILAQSADREVSYSTHLYMYSPSPMISIFDMLAWDLEFQMLISISRPQLQCHAYFSLMAGPTCN